jgi:hypothetical protein
MFVDNKCPDRTMWSRWKHLKVREVLGMEMRLRPARLSIGSEGMGHQPVKMEPALVKLLTENKNILFLMESLL